MTTQEQEGRVAMVTGASYGIGRAISEELARRGAAVLLTDIGETVNDTAAKLRDQGLKGEAAIVDVRDYSSVEEGVARAVDRFGRLDILVNNAAMARSAIPILEMSAEAWDSVMQVNLRGTLFGMQAAARQMARNGGGGRIINIASTAGTRPYKLRAHYGTSKAAIVMLSRYAALEFAEHKITVNCVAPGQTITENLLKLTSDTSDPETEAMRKRQATIPLGVNRPSDIAAAVAYFASPDAGTVTGQLLVVDGGGTMV